MYLSKCDRKLLSSLKSVQQYENLYVYIDFVNMMAYCSNGYQSGEDKDLFTDIHKKIPLEKGKMLEPSLQYLCDLGLLYHDYHHTYSVTHAGWVNCEIQFYEKIKLFMTGALFPALVAFLTTFVTSCISMK